MKSTLQLVIVAILFALIPCTSIGAETGNQDLPKGTVQKGTLANQKLIQDALMGVYAKLATKGHKMRDNDKITHYVVSMPKGSPGSQRWTERWYVEIKGEKIPVTIDFNESGLNAADWTIKD